MITNSGGGGSEPTTTTETTTTTSKPVTKQDASAPPQQQQQPTMTENQNIESSSTPTQQFIKGSIWGPLPNEPKSDDKIIHGETPSTFVGSVFYGDCKKIPETYEDNQYYTSKVNSYTYQVLIHSEDTLSLQETENQDVTIKDPRIFNIGKTGRDESITYYDSGCTQYNNTFPVDVKLRDGGTWYQGPSRKRDTMRNVGESSLGGFKIQKINDDALSITRNDPWSITRVQSPCEIKKVNKKAPPKTECRPNPLFISPV